MSTQSEKRFEQKYVLSAAKATQLRKAVAMLLPRDVHGGPFGYRVRSLYFDTVDGRDAQQVLDGLYARQKVRLRVYDDCNSGFAKLELKKKEGSLVHKISVSVDLEQARKLSRGIYGCLTALEDPAAQLLYATLTRGYLPAAVIEYDRAAFHCPRTGTRITFDSDICAAQSDLGRFPDHSVNCVPVWRTPRRVLELKYSGTLDAALRAIVSDANTSQISVGKYVEGRSIFHYI